MKNLIYTLLIATGIFSCSKPYIETPDNLLSKSDMVDIMADIYLGHQIVNSTPTQNSMLELAQSSMYVLNQHGTDYKTFEESYKYYYIDPSKYQKILDDVKEELENRLSEEGKNRLKEIENDAKNEIIAE